MLNACSAVTPAGVLKPGHLVALCHISATEIPSGTSGFPIMQRLTHSLGADLLSLNVQKHAFPDVCNYIPGTRLAHSARNVQ